MNVFISLKVIMILFGSLFSAAAHVGRAQQQNPLFLEAI